MFFMGTHVGANRFRFGLRLARMLWPQQQNRRDFFRIVQSQKEVTDTGETQHQIGRFPARRDPTRPRQIRSLNLGDRLMTSAFCNLSQIPAAVNVGGGQQQIRVAADSMAEAEITACGKHHVGA